MSSPEVAFNLSTVFDTVASAVPDNEVLVWRDRRFTYRQMNERVDRVADYLAAQGIGCHTPRSELAGHESGQDHVGLYLSNCNEYLECMIGAYRARAAPFNINYRYVTEELRYLFEDARPRVLVYHARFGPQVSEIRDRLPESCLLIQVADDSGNALLSGAVDYETVVRNRALAERSSTPTGDDLYVIYTGGTTGFPKAVLWRQDDAFVTSMGGTPFGSQQAYASYQELFSSVRAAGGGPTLLMTAPFMHGAAQWSSFHMISSGGKIVLPDDGARLEWGDALRVAAREHVVSIPVVGDAMARGLVEELRRHSHDLGGVAAINNGGAPLSPAVRESVLEALPHVMVLDSVGSSETGIQMNSTATAEAGDTVGVFSQDAETTVVDDLFERELVPGEGPGWLASKGRVPLGYLGDAAKTARTFPTIAGTRYSLPGDRATLRADGRIQLLGRDATTINSGGEKIYAEEVERAVAAHPQVRDVIVVGRPSEQWGFEPVAIVQLADENTVTDAELLATSGRHLAGYKVPKAILRRPEIVRSPTGKADYRWASEQVTVD